MKHYYLNTKNPEGIEVLVIIREDGGQIAQDESSRHYQAYLAWVAEGNTAEEWSN